jgi:hypothetical protein
VKKMLFPIVSLFLLGLAPDAAAQQVECRGSAPNVRAVTAPDYHYVTTRFQFDTPNLQPLLTTSIHRLPSADRRHADAGTPERHRSVRDAGDLRVN